jgi:hypothetical protein
MKLGLRLWHVRTLISYHYSSDYSIQRNIVADIHFFCLLKFRLTMAKGKELERVWGALQTSDTRG